MKMWFVAPQISVTNCWLCQRHTRFWRADDAGSSRLRCHLRQIFASYLLVFGMFWNCLSIFIVSASLMTFASSVIFTFIILFDFSSSSKSSIWYHSFACTWLMSLSFFHWEWAWQEFLWWKLIKQCICHGFNLYRLSGLPKSCNFHSKIKRGNQSSVSQNRRHSQSGFNISLDNDDPRSSVQASVAIDIL